ncbi:EVE domain-containing protein [Litoreibacter roseus]|uniref:Uncharacterized protein n=1 Tax=Litoreibacter roseus TaxID=2601869 RepID=A0A6N6JGW8_9RHOB|nr:EVE domain-containing protein [Litoreibacter roseus]GFE65207.1 hypothetical protein KIN_22810 [Litoreibacter roseus]
MARFFIGVAEHDYVQAAVAEGVCLFAGGQRAPVESLEKGDNVAYFSPHLSHGGTALNCFTAMGKVTSETPEEKSDWPDHPKFKSWVRRCSYRPSAPIALGDIEDDLSDQTRAALDTAISEISGTDFSVLAKAMTPQ